MADKVRVPWKDLSAEQKRRIREIQEEIKEEKKDPDTTPEEKEELPEVEVKSKNGRRILIIEGDAVDEILASLGIDDEDVEEDGDEESDDESDEDEDEDIPDEDDEEVMSPPKRKAKVRSVKPEKKMPPEPTPGPRHRYFGR